MYPFHIIFEDNKKFSDYFFNGEDDSITCITNINQINIIIGANNSGKSRFIRNLLNSKLIIVDKKKVQSYNDVIDNNKYVKTTTLSLDNKIKQIVTENERELQRGGSLIYRQLAEKLKDISKEIFLTDINKRRYFVPTLRTAHSLFQIDEHGREGNGITPNVPTIFSKISKDIYKDTLSKYYEFSKDIDVFTGLSLYKEILNTRNSEKKIRDRFSEFEKFLSDNFFKRNTD